MKILCMIFTLILFSCARQVKKIPSNIVSDTMSQGKISVTAKKKMEHQDVCFDIELRMKNVSVKEISGSNWTVAWVDQDSRYHLLVLNQRNPASVPEGSPHEWKNHFRTCAPIGRLGNVGSLILTPKTLPYAGSEGLNLSWK